MAGSARAGGPACGHHGCTSELGERWATAPNAITGARTVATLVLWGLAVQRGSDELLLAAMLVYWVADILDGLVARLTGTETRTGAVLDVLADRLAVCLVVLTYVAAHPDAVLPAGVFLLQFVLVDAYLTLSFRSWSLLSPNYFALVDPVVFRLNWSPVAKATNTAAVVLIVLLTGSIAGATLLAAVVLGIKAYSLARLARVPVPLALSGCAVRDSAPAAVPV